MEILKEYAEKFGVKEVVNDYGEHRQTRERSIVFPNGWVASIVKNNGVDVWHPNGEHTKEFKSDKKYSVAMCDYNGCFDWEILDQYGAIEGCIYCDDELEILSACETIRRLPNKRIYENGEKHMENGKMDVRNTVVNVKELIDVFKDMADRGTLLTGNGITQMDLYLQITGAIVATAMKESN